MDSAKTFNPQGGTGSLRASGAAAVALVTSDISADLPITEGEIRLVLAFLGDTITQIFDAGSPECPVQAKPQGE